MQSSSSRHTKPRPARRWIELLLAGSFIMMVALIAVPVQYQTEVTTQVDSIEITVHRLQRAAKRFIDDNGRGAVEFSGSAYLEPRFHDLSRDTGLSNWHGPYISPGLTTADNPYGGFVYLYDSLRGGAATPLNAFRLNGEGGPVAPDAGQFIAFGRVPESAAAAIDARLDANIEGDWQRMGRVQYDSGPAGTLMVYLCPIDIWGSEDR